MKSKKIKRAKETTAEYMDGLAKRTAERNVGPLFMAICGLVSTAITPNCTDINTNGLDVIIYVANWSEVASYTENSTTKAIESITMASTKKFYAWEGKLGSNNAKESLVNGKYQNAFSHQIDALFFGVTATEKLQLQALANGSVMVIVKYKYKGTTANCKYALHGLDQGLRLTALERDQTNADNAGVYAITLKTPDGFPETKLARTVWVTSESATDAVIAGLL